jgi:MFS transporter, FHS family, glucose/mannose:H+ symporter
MPQRADGARAATFFIYATFFVTGIVTTILGPLLPQFSTRWHIDDVLAGSLFTAEFAGAIVGALASGVILPRLGFRRALLIGYLLTGAGMIWLSFAGWHGGLTAVGIIGVSLGLTIAATNLLVAEANPRRRAAAVSILNFVWGLGAVTIPILVSAGGAARVTVLLISIGAVSLVISAIFAAIAMPHIDEHTTREAAVAEEVAGAIETGGEQGAAALSGRSAWSNGLLWTIAVMFFIYVGIETAVGGWIATFAQRLHGVEYWFAILAPSFFWGGLLVGRGTAPLIFRRVSENGVARGALAISAVGIAVIFFAHGLPGAMSGAFVTGLGFAPIYPIIVSEFSGKFGAAARRLGGVIFASPSLGGATVPWLVGFVSTKTNNLRMGLLLPLGGALMLLAIFFASAKATAR